MGRYVPKDGVGVIDYSIESLDLTIEGCYRELAAINAEYLVNSNETFDLNISMESLNDRIKASVQKIKEWLIKFVKFIAETFKKIVTLGGAKTNRAKAKVNAAKEAVASVDNSALATISKQTASEGIKVHTRFAKEIR